MYARTVFRATRPACRRYPAVLVKRISACLHFGSAAALNKRIPSPSSPPHAIHRGAAAKRERGSFAESSSCAMIAGYSSFPAAQTAKGDVNRLFAFATLWW
jgi:hypothetical protein